MNWLNIIFGKYHLFNILFYLQLKVYLYLIAMHTNTHVCV